MKVFSFIADNTAAALEQIHAQLGPDAIVLSVKPVREKGLARLLPGKRKIEVLAGVPDKTSAGNPSALPPKKNPVKAFPKAISDEDNPDEVLGEGSQWRSVRTLQTIGLLPVNAELLQHQLNELVAGNPPTTLDAEWKAIRTVFTKQWQAPRPLYEGNSRPHVFIGPPGSGKTSVLCKWLTLATLTEERTPCVWRLDNAMANTAEFLGIHCEMLGVPVERFWGTIPPQTDLLFVDMPGIETTEAQAVAALKSQLALLPSPRIHLVLNAAYETSRLLAHWEAFAPFEPEDLIFTHMDEEAGRVKLWNFVFGTNCSLRFLSAGQKIPGEFRTATPELLFPTKKAR